MYGLARIKILAAFLLLFLPSVAKGAAIQNAYVEALSAFTLTGASGDTWTTITGASISSGSFTVGKKYLIVATGLMKAPLNTTVSMRVVHGSTAFDGSTYQKDSNSGAGIHEWSYTFFTVWTAASEAVSVQLSRLPESTAASVTAKQVTLFAMNLSDDLTENTDWGFNAVTADTALTTSDSSTNNASVTLTPGEAGQNWLVMSLSQVTWGGTGNLAVSKLVRSGEAATSQPSRQHLARDATNEKMVMFNLYPLTLGASSNTFEEKSNSVGANIHTRNYSAVFMLNLSKFKESVITWTQAEVALSTTSYATEIAGLGITPSDNGFVYILGAWAHDGNPAANAIRSRIQVDGTTQPGTADVQRELGNTGGAEVQVMDAARIAVTASTVYDIDYDASVQTSGFAEDRAMAAFTMELVAAAASARRTRTMTTQ